MGTHRRAGEHWEVITLAAAEVGPALFFSLLIITLSFLPVFTLRRRRAGCSHPSPSRRPGAMAASAAPRGDAGAGADGLLHPRPDPAEDRNPLNVFLIWLYRPLLNAVMRLPRLTPAGGTCWRYSVWSSR